MSSATSQSLTAVNSTDGLIYVHKAGCQHLGRATKRSNDSFPLTASTREEVIEAIWGDFIPEWGNADKGWASTDFAPCVKIK